jgi:hypothetical protein
MLLLPLDSEKTTLGFTVDFDIATPDNLSFSMPVIVIPFRATEGVSLLGRRSDSRVLPTCDRSLELPFNPDESNRENRIRAVRTKPASEANSPLRKPKREVPVLYFKNRHLEPTKQISGKERQVDSFHPA